MGLLGNRWHCTIDGRDLIFSKDSSSRAGGGLLRRGILRSTCRDLRDVLCWVMCGRGPDGQIAVLSGRPGKNKVAMPSSPRQLVASCVR